MAARELALAGLSVALVDKASFPRDKACGDLVGPKGVALLEALGIAPLGAIEVGDMVVAGPGGHRVRLPATPGLAYPGRAWSIPRHVFDHHLHTTAQSAGARAITARVAGLAPPGGPRRRMCTVVLQDGRRIGADFVIGADGATSGVAKAAGLVDMTQTLWGFAIRAYATCEVPLPLIAFWEERKMRAFPGYGWAFSGPGGRANLGLGVSVGTDRTKGALATKALDRFLAHLSHSGLITGEGGVEDKMGGWLKMGMVGTRPARGRVLLVGDAAGLVNPLQGEGISQALASGVAAAQAIIATPSNAAGAYSAWLRKHHAPYQSATAVLQASLAPHPVLVSLLGRALTAPGIGRAVAPTWGLYWNELLEGSRPGPPRTLAITADLALRAITAGHPSRQALKSALRWA